MGDVDPIGLAAAMFQIEHAPGVSGPWTANGPEQQAFLDRYLDHQHVSEGLVSGSELLAFASNRYQAINKAAVDAGYPSIQLNPFPETDMGAIAVVNLKFLWQVPGILNDGKPFNVNGNPAFRLTNDTHGVQFANLHTDFQDDWVIKIPTSTPGDTVFIYPYKRQPVTGLEFYGFMNTLHQHIYDVSRTWEGVQLPMVSFRKDYDLSWAIGMRCGGHQLSQAKQAAMFDMDHNGGKGGSGTALAVTRSVPKFFEVNGPFGFVLHRQGVGSIMVCAITEEYFKEPSPTNA